MDWRYLTDCRFQSRCTNPNCPFRHQVSSPSESSQLSDEICDGWMTYSCTNVKCSKRHPASAADAVRQNVQRLQPPLPAHSNDEKLKKTVVCKFFLLGTCKAKHTCPFLHEFPEAEYKRHDTSGSTKDDETLTFEIDGNFSDNSIEATQLASDGKSILGKYSFSAHIQRSNIDNVVTKKLRVERNIKVSSLPSKR